jgi:hypothetical protein
MTVDLGRGRKVTVLGQAQEDLAHKVTGNGGQGHTIVLSLWEYTEVILEGVLYGRGARDYSGDLEIL